MVETIMQLETTRDAHNSKTINRIKRIRGQLGALEDLITADTGTCEERVVRARTIEKGMSSLINHLFDCYIENSLRHDMRSDPKAAVDDLQRILKLINS